MVRPPYDLTGGPTPLQRRPLGFHFDRKAPITVKGIQSGSHAREIGVKIGWMVVTINGEEVSEKKFWANYCWQIITHLKGIGGYLRGSPDDQKNLLEKALNTISLKRWCAQIVPQDESFQGS